MNIVPFEILPYGDCALLVEFENRVDRSISQKVLALNDEMQAIQLPGVSESLPTFKSLLVKYNPVETDFDTLSAALKTLATKAPTAYSGGTMWHIPVCYDGEYAPDLNDVAGRLDLPPEEVITLHNSVSYHIYMVGFLAGCPYLGDMPDRLFLPRRESPRTHVPAGSIAIAMNQSVIYPLVTPGGWHLIGKTPIEIFDHRKKQPALFSPGDTVIFNRIEPPIFEEIRQEVKAGEFDFNRLRDGQ